MAAFELNNIGRTISDTEIMEHFIKPKIGSKLDAISDRVIPLDIPSCTRSIAKEDSFSGVSMEFSFLASIVGARRADPNTAAKSSKFGEVLLFVKSKLDRGSRFSAQWKCILHSKVMVECIWPQLDVHIISDQVRTNAFGSSAMSTFGWTILFAVVGTGGTNVKSTFLENFAD